MNRDNFYTNKVVLITGGSMGIGKELARQILNFGGKVVITGRNTERLERVQNEFSEHQQNLICHAANVSDFDESLHMVEKIISVFGRLDVLINNAGISDNGELEKYNYKAVNEIIDTNIKGVLFSTMAAIPELKKTKGSILMISSIAGFFGLPGHSLYSLSKMSLTALTQSLCIENKPNQIFVGIAYVGFTKNEAEKKRISPDGIPEPIPERNKWFTKSREETARILLKQIERRKNKVIHSFLGKFTYFMTVFFPRLLFKISGINYQKNIHKKGKSN